VSAPILPACHADACSQGRAKCPCPQACGLPADELDEVLPSPVVLYVILAVVGVICAASPLAFF